MSEAKGTRGAVPTLSLGWQVPELPVPGQRGFGQPHSASHTPAGCFPPPSDLPGLGIPGHHVGTAGWDPSGFTPGPCEE